MPRTPKILRELMMMLLLAGVLAPAARAVPVTTAFTYQGQLQKAAAPYTGAADFVFRLYDDPAAGTQVGADVSVAGLVVTQGLFSAELDFGNVFTGEALWLEVLVQTPGDADYTTLTPRQPLTASPFALHALSAPAGSGTGPWAVDAFGATHPGNIGIGGGSRPDRRLMIEGGTSNNSIWLRNNTVNYATLVVQNDAANGYGIYDAWSDRHFIDGKVGIGTSNPGFPLDVYGYLTPSGRFTSVGSTLTAGTHAALYVAGLTGGGLFGGPSDGIYASSVDGRGVSGWSTNNYGVSGDCTSAGTAGILGTPNEGIYAFSLNVARPAARFAVPAGGTAIDAGSGLVKVKTLQILGGSDLAEPFDVTGAASAAPEPGTVVIIDEHTPGDLRVCDGAYDTRVAGVISGANDLAPGMVMRASDSPHADGAHPVALTGRVWCKVDAAYGAVRPGDLLTTSDTPGHAMRADDVSRRGGAVIGKAMTSLEAGRGLVLVLVSLQ